MIDWDRIAELREEVGEEDFDEVIEMFLEEVEDTLGGLSTADSDGLASGLHFLKGAALNIGMSDLSELCRAYEEALKSDGASAVALEKIKTTLESSQSELREMFGGS